MTLKPKRYEIYFADLNPTIGSEISKIRLVVIVSQNEMNLFLAACRSIRISAK
jgi:mRNA interferase MazF